MYQIGDPKLGVEILFRDYLRHRRERAMEYQSLKEKLSVNYWNGPGAYTDGKTVFIQQMLNEAAEWTGRKGEGISRSGQ